VRVVTFYSYKGGVGRTQALVNVAAGLARSGKRVLLVDFDLEAPGLDAIRGVQFETGPGIVELIGDYLSTGVAPRVEKYVRQASFVQLGVTETRRSRTERGGGAVFVLPAGNRSDEAAYKRRLAGIDFNHLYAERQGYLLFEDLRCQWRDSLNLDYVLIDSRTGHTDVGGICVRQLPDHVFLMLYPNEQNLQGLASVADEAREEPRSLEVDAVMSRVPFLDDYEQHLFQFEIRARKRLQVPSIYKIHSYESIHIIRDEIFLANRALDRTRLSKEYRDLVRAIVVRNIGDRAAVLDSLESGAVKVRRVVGSERMIEWFNAVRARYRGDDEVLERLAVALRRRGLEAQEREVRADIARLRLAGSGAKDLARATALEAANPAEAAQLASKAISHGAGLALTRRLEAFLLLCRLDSSLADDCAVEVNELPASSEWVDEHWELLSRRRGGLLVARRAYERAGFEPWFGPGKQADGLSGVREDRTPLVRQSERLGIAAVALGPATAAMYAYSDDRICENMVLLTRAIDSLPCAPFRTAAEFGAWIRFADRRGEGAYLDRIQEVRQVARLRNSGESMGVEGEPEFEPMEMCLELACGIRPDSSFATRLVASLAWSLVGDTSLAHRTVERIRAQRATLRQKGEPEPWVFNHWQMLTRPLAEVERDLSTVIEFHEKSELVQSADWPRLFLRPPFLGERAST
jgi:MinD-like ATPase involved in chromosome partitioning or flagellar assembly